MNTKHGPKFLKKLNRKDSFEIQSAGISPDKAITELAKTAFELGAAASHKRTSDVAHLPTEYLETLVAIASNAWKAKKKMADLTTGEVRDEMVGVHRHIEAIYRNLAKVGIVIRDHTGDPYDEGQPMNVIASKPTPGLDKKRVSETLLPSILWNDRLIQNGNIEIATPSAPHTSAESQSDQI